MPSRSPRGRKPAPSSLPQPKPLGTAIICTEDGTALIIRHFEPEDVPACTRCETCTAYRGSGDPRGHYHIIDRTFDPTDHRPVMVCALWVPTKDLLQHAF